MSAYSVFDPTSLKKYSVIFIYYKYPNELPENKYFVVISHEEVGGKKCVLCLKATANTEKYKNDKAQMAGCVFYEANQLQFFKKDTAIQPDNPLGLQYEYIISEEKKGRFKIVGEMPVDFKGRLEAAIGSSTTIPKKRKAFLLGML